MAVVAAANTAASNEQAQTLTEAFRSHRKAAMRSVLVSSAIVMEGCNFVLVSSLFAQPAFAQRYGTYSESEAWPIPGAWQSAPSAAPTIGSILGPFANGYLVHKLAYRHDSGMMSHTNELEIEAETGTSYSACFKGVDLRRTEVACMTFAAKVWCRSSLGGSPAYYFVQAGVSTSNSFKCSTKGRTYEALDLLFANKVTARDFRKVVVGPYALPVEQIRKGAALD